MTDLATGTPRKRVRTLRFGRHNIPMTEDEAADLERAFADWIAKGGIPYGFVRGLLHVRG